MSGPTSPTSTDLARSSLRQLLARWSAAGIDTSSINEQQPPELLLVRGDRLETWKLRPREGKGGESVFELLEVRTLKGART